MIFFAGVFFVVFFVGAFLIIFLTGFLFIAVAIGLEITDLLIDFFSRYLELSNARIGMNINSKNMSPSPNAQCFQNFFVMLKMLTIETTRNNGGKSIANVHRPDIPHN